MTGRFVGVRAKLYQHAVWVDADLEAAPKLLMKDRADRSPLVRISFWRAQAECGQEVSPVVAGPRGGHDWELVPNRDRCLRCQRKIEAQPQPPKEHL